ncbi:hypothetical protein JQU17_07185 [Ponticoccus sp. SC2-23]|uniref:flagellin N-terminal helical domain-containing protein n=1 Tax=Alexandriicola marinus TaxID=2081710 RepID=UPI000FDB863B|nr:flagellin [Alexandriicola marinus]MBM1220530.1 hypothetical protein [Ponticoccus sp. SC6-9]MBM1225216.1 hypothetical protein [Ponticoccus sp. SC6-15]MBM1228730.1 hypothetical protein [Ponticoccus sp. SC6-38]MBM1233633.1 hypothetical protein [Ponticoccus sp. SC6-45]MBM1239231.1 hypothetical protein [Ponticoccus sp. SC6-49]MBM1243013.1 hypothetical protein [Ponticoccus sp. SC2-64]MBM1247157.1 hypothetical protein [Ponticoccus sp. SC6-42]MBM1252184.1 hypothetical protein [Ponticoccus sp. SC
MTYSGLGDMARYFTSSRVNFDIRTRLDALARELSTGLKLDPARDLGAEAARVPEIERRLALVDRQVSSASQIADRLGVMQASLENISTIGTNLMGQLNSLSQSSGNDWRQDAARLGKGAIEDMVSTLNTRFAGSFLFSGVAEDGQSLSSALVILDDIGTAIAGVTTADDLINAIDSWFADTGGGFETIAYLGDNGDAAERRIDDLTSIRIDLRGDDPALRELMAGAALAFFAEDQSIVLSDAERDAVIDRASQSLFSASSGVADLRGRLGGLQQRVDDARARLTAEQTSFGLMRSTLLAADPFETATALEQVQLQLETHYAVTARLSQLSLTRYL